MLNLLLINNLTKIFFFHSYILNNLSLNNKESIQMNVVKELILIDEKISK